MNFFATAVKSNWSVLSLSMKGHMQWLRCGCSMLVHRKVLRGQREEYVCSAVTVMIGIVRIGWSRHATSLNIILLLGIVLKTSARVLR